MISEDEVGTELDRTVRAALMGISVQAEALARRLDSRARENERRIREAAQEAERANRDQQRVRAEQARAINQRVRRKEFWRSATPEQVHDLVMHVASTTPVDANEQGNLEIVTEQAQERYGLDVVAVAKLEPGQRTQAIADAFVASAENRFTQDNPEVMRTVYDRVRRREFWEQTTPDQIGEVANLTGRLAPWDRVAAEADAVVREQLSARWDIDLVALREANPQPEALQAAVTGAVAEGVEAKRSAKAAEDMRNETRMVYDRVRRKDFWEQATTEQVVDAVTYARAVAENDPVGREAQKVIEEQLHTRYGIDLRQTATEGSREERRRALADALEDHIILNREAAAEREAATADRDQAATRAARADAARDESRTIDGTSGEEVGVDGEQIAVAPPPDTGQWVDADVARDETTARDLEASADVHDERAAQLQAQSEVAPGSPASTAAAAARPAVVGRAPSAERAAPKYQRVTDAELAKAPPAAAAARRQATTSFPRSTAAGLRASGNTPSTRARTERGPDQRRTRGHELGR